MDVEAWWARMAVLSVGGVLGVNARYWLGAWISRWASPQFPWPTFLINVSGSFAIGLLTVLLVRWLPHPHVRLMVLTGFLGGFTTFSTFALESAMLWERGESGRSLAYMTGSTAAGLVAVALGIGLGRSLSGSDLKPPPTTDHAVVVAGGATLGPVHPADSAAPGDADLRPPAFRPDS